MPICHCLRKHPNVPINHWLRKHQSVPICQCLRKHPSVRSATAYGNTRMCRSVTAYGNTRVYPYAANRAAKTLHRHIGDNTLQLYKQNSRGLKGRSGHFGAFRVDVILGTSVRQYAQCGLAAPPRLGALELQHPRVPGQHAALFLILRSLPPFLLAFLASPVPAHWLISLLPPCHCHSRNWQHKSSSQICCWAQTRTWVGYLSLLLLLGEAVMVVVVVVVAAVVMVVVVRLLVLMLLMASSTLGSTEFLSCVRKGLVWLGSFLWSTKVDVFLFCFCFFVVSTLIHVVSLSFSCNVASAKSTQQGNVAQFCQTQIEFREVSSPSVVNTLIHIFLVFGVSYPSNKSLQICYTNTNGDVLNVRVLGNCRPHSHWVF